MNRERERCPGSEQHPFYKVTVNLRSNRTVGECSICHATGLDVDRKTGRIAEHDRFRPLPEGERPSVKQSVRDIWGD